MTFLRRLVALLVMLVCLVVFVACIGASVGSWVVRQRGITKVQELAGRLKNGLERASVADREVQKALEKASENLEKVSKDSANLGGGDERSRKAATFGLRKLVHANAGPQINDVSGRMAMFSDAAVVVSSLLQSLQESPLGQDSSIDQEQLGRMSEGASKLSAGIQKLRTSIGESDTAASEKDVAEASREVDQVLQDCLTVVREISARLEKARNDLPRIEAQVVGWMKLSAIIVTAVCSWVALSQICLFVCAWKWCRGA
jgi:hypothetical protein